MEDGTNERYPWIVEDAGDEDAADLVEEREELASAHDLCTALRWHHDFIAWCAGGVDEDDLARIALYQRISADLERAHASVIAYYEGLAVTEAVAPFAQGGTGRPAAKPPRLVDPAQVQCMVSAMQRRQAVQSIEDIFAVMSQGRRMGRGGESSPACSDTDATGRSPRPRWGHGGRTALIRRFPGPARSAPQPLPTVHCRRPAAGWPCVR